jgi:hypothetical protein
MSLTDWPILLLFAAALASAGYLLGRRSAVAPRRLALPSEWSLMARTVLDADERRALRALHDAMPQHVVLAKLPLVRLCQPRDGQRASYWYELLGPLQVSFVVCSANGRVLAVVDLETERNSSRRARAIKQAVLDACRIRYLACTPQTLPPPAELQLLLPLPGSATRTAPMAAQPTPGFLSARSNLSDTVRARRAERSALWADSGLPQDSFFAPDSRFDSVASGFSASTQAPLTADEGGLPRGPR